MNFDCCNKTNNYTSTPYVTNVPIDTLENKNFRTTIWTGKHVQMTVMNIAPKDEIGLEMHSEVDQVIRVEFGNAFVYIGNKKENLIFRQKMCKGDVVFIPAGLWHNIVNTDRFPLKLSVIYAPANHPKGTVHHTKMDVSMEKH